MSFGYYIEISKANLHHAPADYERKQTLVNAERFTTPELKELESKILDAEDKMLASEREIFQELRLFAAGTLRESANRGGRRGAGCYLRAGASGRGKPLHAPGFFRFRRDPHRGRTASGNRKAGRERSRALHPQRSLF
jgi:hypothetical protein